MITSKLLCGASALTAVAALGPLATSTPAAAAPAKGTPQQVLPIASDGTITTAAELAALPRRKAVHARPGLGPSTKDGNVHGCDLSGQRLGEVGINAIIGTDDRYRTTPTNWWPSTATVQLTRLINCVRTQYCTWAAGSAAKGCLVYPGRDGSSAQFGSCGAVSFHSNAAWVNKPERGVRLRCDQAQLHRRQLHRDLRLPLAERLAHRNADLPARLPVRQAIRRIWS